MFLTVNLVWLLIAALPDGTLVRLEPAELVELEALETIRTDSAMQWSDGRLDRTLPSAELKAAALALTRGPRVVVWVHAIDETVEVHFLTTDGRERVRSLPYPPGTSTAALSENVAALVRSQLTTVMRTPLAPIPVEPPAPKPAAVVPTVVAAAPTLPRPRFQVLLGYLSGTLGEGFAWQHGVRLLASVLPQTFRFRLSLDAYLPTLVRQAAADFQIERQAASLTGGPRWQWRMIRGAVEGGVDVERLRRVVVRTTQGEATAPGQFFLPSGVLAASLGIQLGWLCFEASLRAKVPLRAVEFQVEPEGTLARTSPARLEAVLAAGVEW
jgi:hypothetical protein